MVGLKDSSGDWSYSEALLAAYPGFRVLSGSETFLLDNLRHGGGGCITATGNVNARRIRAVYDALPGRRRGTRTRSRPRSPRCVPCIQTKPVVPTLKHLVAHYRDDPGWTAVRPPFRSLPAADGAEVRSELERDHGYAPAFPRAAAARRVA